MSLQKIGITTTIPVEVIYAAGAVPVDLNNAFVDWTDSRDLVARAEREGFSQSTCAWVKGLYATAKAIGIKDIVGVIEGDCSQNAALLDIWRVENFNVHNFSFPDISSPNAGETFCAELISLARALGADIARAKELKIEFDEIRKLAAGIDVLAVEKGCVASGELFESQLCLTDFEGDPRQCRQKLEAKLAEYSQRSESLKAIRLGVVGVPTILSDLWQVIDECGARVVYHEVPYEFSLIKGIGMSMADAFGCYTYASNALVRIAEIKKQSDLRGLEGIIHYTQSFCHRQLHDIILRREMDIPVLTIEADRPGKVDGRTITRIEAFLEQLAS